MRRQEKEINDPGLVSEILSKSSVCRLGLVEDGEAYIVPVNYAFKDGTIYIHSAVEGRKIDILKRNPMVTFEIELLSETVRSEVACRWGTKYRSVMGKGTVKLHRDKGSKVACFNLLMEKYGPGFAAAYDESALDKALVIELTIEYCTGKQSGVW